jgi:hypothetical protein
MENSEYFGEPSHAVGCNDLERIVKRRNMMVKPKGLAVAKKHRSTGNGIWGVVLLSPCSVLSIYVIQRIALWPGRPLNIYVDVFIQSS